MQLPKINTVIVCDDVRFEKFGKVSLMGVFGVIPKVKILVKDIATPIPRLTFYLSTEGAEGKIKLSAKIIRPQGKESITIVGEEKEFFKTSKTDVFVFTIGLFIPQTTGEFQFQVHANDSRVFNSTFQVQIGEPKNFEL